MSDFSPELRKAFLDFYRPHAGDAAGEAIGSWAGAAVFACLSTYNLWGGDAIAAAFLAATAAGLVLYGRHQWTEYRRIKKTMREFQR